MARWGSELYPRFLPHPLPRPADTTYVAIYSAEVDVDIVRAELRFNESLHPDEILKALLVDNWGSLSIGPWPPDGCTERNRFRLMALWKTAIFLNMMEYIQARGEPERPRQKGQPEPAEWPRTWAYARFPAVQEARDAGSGPYRSCTFEARIDTGGFVANDYYLPDDGAVPPGLESDRATMCFVRALVQTDLRQRIEALTDEDDRQGGM